MRSALRGLPKVAPALRAAPQARYMASKPEVNNMTGNTGFAVAAAGGSAYLLSQEILILHTETVVVFSMAAMVTFLYKKAGPDIAALFDERAQSIADSLSVAKNAKKASLTAEMQAEKDIAPSLANVAELFAIDKEIGALSRELAFREAKIEARNAVVKELDQLVLMENQVAQIEKDLLVAATIQGVMKDIESQEGAILKQCIADLEGLSASQ